MQKLADSLANSSKAIVIANFAMYVFLGGILQQLFGVMNKLQIMVHLLIINATIPAVA